MTCTLPVYVGFSPTAVVEVFFELLSNSQLEVLGTKRRVSLHNFERGRANGYNIILHDDHAGTGGFTSSVYYSGRALLFFKPHLLPPLSLRHLSRLPFVLFLRPFSFFSTSWAP